MASLDLLLEHAALPEDIRDLLRAVVAGGELREPLAETLEVMSTRILQQREDLAQALQELHALAEERQSKRLREEKLRHRLSFNEKSGLPNHYAMEGELPGLLDAMREDLATETGADLLIISVEDSYAHLRRSLPKQVTEWLLYATAEELQRLLRPEEKLYHVREGEFVFLARREPGADPDQRVEELVTAAAGTFAFPDYSVTLRAYAGVAHFPRDAMDRYHLLRKADIALSTARARRALYVRFEESMEEHLVEKMDLQNHIIRALEKQAIIAIDQQFELQLQPIVACTATERENCEYHLEGGEALIRWNHPKHGRVSPAQFIPVAEESGLIVPIGNWVIFHAAEILGRWNEPPFDKLTLSINVSPRQFRDEHLLENLEKIVSQHRLQADRLRLEITESTVMEQPDEAADKLAAISDLGILTAIDDFGTGYSSLSFLRRFSFQELKLDKSFIDDFLVNRSSRRIVTAIVDMAQAIGVSVIAEGVESPLQAVALASIGVTHMQGYLFGAPVDVATFRGSIESFSGTVSGRESSP